MDAQSSSDASQRGIVFILSNLSLDEIDPQNDAHRRAICSPHGIENIAAVYSKPLNHILSSRLHAAGLIRAIYVYFEPQGYYELNANANINTPPLPLEAQLRVLFQEGSISDPFNDEMIWRKIPDLPSLVSALPVSRKIGCLNGFAILGCSQRVVNYIDYISAAPHDQIYVFVVGQISEEIRTYVDDFVKVSNFDLDAIQCLLPVIYEMERKWDILERRT